MLLFCGEGERRARLFFRPFGLLVGSTRPRSSFLLMVIRVGRIMKKFASIKPSFLSKDARSGRYRRRCRRRGGDRINHLVYKRAASIRMQVHSTRLTLCNHHELICKCSLTKIESIPIPFQTTIVLNTSAY